MPARSARPKRSHAARRIETNRQLSRTLWALVSETKSRRKAYRNPYPNARHPIVGHGPKRSHAARRIETRTGWLDARPFGSSETKSRRKAYRNEPAVVTHVVGLGVRNEVTPHGV